MRPRWTLTLDQVDPPPLTTEILALKVCESKSDSLETDEKSVRNPFSESDVLTYCEQNIKSCCFCYL